MKKNMVFRCLLLITIILLLFLYFNIDDYTYAMDNDDSLMNDYILNPKWIEYMESSDSEKARYNLIPSKFLYKYQKNVNNSNFNSMLSLATLVNNDDEYPSYYNLHDLGLVTEPKDQGDTGLCWAFAANSSVESNLLVSGISTVDNPIILSERQLDYATVSSNFIYEKYNPYYDNIRTELGSAGFIETPFQLYSFGVSPVTSNIFGEFNDDLNTIKTLNEVFSIDNVEYYVDGYERIGLIWSHNSNNKESFILKIKNHIMKYGALSFITIGTRPYYGGSCLYYDEANNNYLINVLDVNCNPKVRENLHAMSIIGWDDDYKYEYCRNFDSTTSDLNGCSNVVKGQGAFILKNSWGDEAPYPYIAYDSNFEEVSGVTSVSVKNWDNNYDKLKSFSIETNDNEYISTFYTDSRLKEKIKKISFDVSSSLLGSTIKVFINIDGKNYIDVGQIKIDYIGRHFINLDSDIISNDNFKIKFVLEQGEIFDVYAFTSYIEKSEEIEAYTFAKDNDVYNAYTSEFELYTYTKNISNGNILQYKVLDENGIDISSLVDISNNVVFNNATNLNIKFFDKIKFKNIVIQTIFNNKVLDNFNINIKQEDNLWQSGDGTIDNPYIIYDLEDFLNIGTSDIYMGANYKLGADIDFSSIEWNINKFTKGKIFTGSLDGNDYMLSGFRCSGTWCSIFADAEDAEFKNLVINDFVISDGGNWSSVLVASATNCFFENIIMTESVSVSGFSIDSGSLVAVARDSTFKRIANYGTFEVFSDIAEVGGIVNLCYGCIISESYNYGTVKVFGNDSVYAGGIAGACYISTNTFNYTEISNVFNYGTVISNDYAGGIVGIYYSGYISNSYSISMNEGESDIYGNIVGKSYGLVLKNLYYNNNGKNALGEDLNNLSTFVNVSDKSLDLLKQKSSYSGFDFDNIWNIEGDFPYLKEFNYSIVKGLSTESNIVLNVGEERKLEVMFIPLNAIRKKLIYVSSDENIVSIDDSGNMKANGIGSVKITVMCKDDNKISKDIDVQVIYKLKSKKYDIINDSYIKINKISTKEEFVDEIKIENNLYSFKVTESNNKNICTGDKLFVYDNKGNLLKTYVISLVGDITGSGTIKVSDVSKLYQYVKGVINMDLEYQIAADVNFDGKVKVSDVSKLFQYVKGNIKNLEV